MFSRRTLFALVPALAVSAMLAVAPASAETSNFTRAKFEAAQAAGKSIVVDIHATWCPTCRAQMAMLDRLETEDQFKDVVILRVDYDTQKDVMRSFGASQRSTLIAFRGKTETGRVVGDTREGPIRALLESAYQGS